MLTHRQLRYFVEIVGTGSFNAAAECLCVTQSFLRQQVREMEGELQVILLAHDTPHPQMTAAGRSLYADARSILAAFEEAAANAASAERGGTGELRLLHCGSAPLHGHLLAVLRQHAQQHPGATVDLALADPAHQAVAIHEGRADFGLAHGPVVQRHQSVYCRALYEERLVALIPEGHGLAGKTCIELPELRHECFVDVPRSGPAGLGHRVAELCRAHGFEPGPAPMRASHWNRLSLIQAGFGVAVAPESMGHLLPAGIRCLELQGDSCTSTVFAQWRHDAPMAVGRLADLFLARFESAAHPA